MDRKNILLSWEYDSLLETRNRLQEDLKHTLMDNSWLNSYIDDWLNKTSIDIIIWTQSHMLKQIEDILSNCEVISNEALENDNEQICKIWKMVELEYEDWTRKIVNICGKKPLKSKEWFFNASYDSPIVRTIIWKEIWDDFELEINWKKISWKIVSIKNMFV